MGLPSLLVTTTLTLLLAAAGPQVTVTVPTEPVPGETGRQGDRDYGPPHVAELASVVFMTETRRDHVITRGVLEMFRPSLYWTLRDGSATVLIIPGHGVGSNDLDPMVGRPVEVRGIVRMIRKKEYLGPLGVDRDLVEDPSLPAMPAPDAEHGLPRVSLTVLSLGDRGDRGTSKTAAVPGALTREIIDNPADYLGKTVRLLGQFRGSNLFGDLPSGSRREDADWILKTGELAIWVTGKPPRGKGWSLDPGYKGDTERWVDVVGKAEVVGGIVYLRASKVALAAKPKEGEAEDP